MTKNGKETQILRHGVCFMAISKEIMMMTMLTMVMIKMMVMTVLLLLMMILYSN